MKNYSIYLAFMLLLACKNKQEEMPKPAPEHFVPHTEAEIRQTYHIDTTYEYEYRTGEAGDYQYNYDVSGTDSNGDEFSGNVSVRGKYGEGTVTDANGNETEIEVRWSGHGKLTGTDKSGNEYELDVE